MSTSEHPDSGGGQPPRRAVGIGLVAALVVGLGIVAVRVLSHRESPDAGAPSTLAESAGATEGEAHFSAPTSAPPEGANGSTPAVPSAPIAPLDSSSTDGWRDIRGHVVRASDGSPIGSATVVAQPQAADTGGAADELQVRTGRDGGFTLRVPAGMLNFRVTLPESALPRDPARPESRVDGRVEWDNGDPLSGDVRIVMESGWRLDVHLVEGEGRPRAGLVVGGGGRSAKSNGDGQCVLLDLPLGGPITLTLELGGGRTMTQPVEAPEPGSLRKSVTINVP
jgi:hypothetical protein